MQQQQALTTKLPGEGPETGLRFDLIRGLVSVPVAVNDSAPAHFILDTGSSCSVLTPDFARALKLHTSGTERSQGPGMNNADMPLAKHVHLRLGPVPLPDQTIAIVPLDYVTRAVGYPVQGILAMSALAGLCVETDYPARQLRFHDAACWVPPAGADVIAVILKDNVPMVHASVSFALAGRFWGNFILDSGLVGGLQLSVPFARHHADILRLEAAPETSSIQAVGGTLRIRRVHPRALAFGRQHIPAPATFLSEQAAGILDAPGIDGIIGNESLLSCRFFCDYSHHRVALAAPGTK